MIKLQVALQALEGQTAALRQIGAMSGAPDPNMASCDVRLRSTRALRQWHRRHRRSARVDAARLALYAEKWGLPAGGDHRTELGLVPDVDVCLLVLQARHRALRDVDPEAATHLLRRASLAAPERLYARARVMRKAQYVRLASRRHRSVDARAREDKSFVYVPPVEEVGTVAAKKADAAGAPPEARKAAAEGDRLELPPLPPIHVFRPPRSALEAAQDYDDGARVRAYCEGVRDSLAVASKWLEGDAVLAFEQERLAPSAALTPVAKTLLMSQVLPGKLFVAPPPPRPPVDVRTIVDRDADKRDAAAFETRRIRAEAKSPKRGRADAAPAAPEKRRSRSASVAAPERLSAYADFWRRFLAMMRDQRANPAKYRAVHGRAHYANLTGEDLPSRPADARASAAFPPPPPTKPADDASAQSGSTAAAAASALADDVVLTKDQWGDQARLVEVAAMRAGRMHWIREEEKESSSSDDESSDGDSDEEPEKKEKRRAERKAARKAEKKRVKEEAAAEEKKRVEEEKARKAEEASRAVDTGPDEAPADAAAGDADAPGAAPAPAPAPGGAGDDAARAVAEAPGSRRPSRGSRGDPPLPPGWELAHDDDGNAYYFNADTGETSWTPPDADG